MLSTAIMPQFDLFHWFTWLLAIFALGVVTVMLVRRKLYPEFPVFIAYVIVQLVGMDGDAMGHSPVLKLRFLYGWFVMQCLDAVLSMAVLLEVFSVMLKPYAGIRQTGHPGLRCSGNTLCCDCSLDGDSRTSLRCELCPHYRPRDRMAKKRGLRAPRAFIRSYLSSRGYLA